MNDDRLLGEGIGLGNALCAAAYGDEDKVAAWDDWATRARTLIEGRQSEERPREKPTRTEEEPHDRLTRLCDTAMDAIEAHDECGGHEQLIVFMNSGNRTGLAMRGYDNDTEAIADLFLHLRALMQANGKDLAFVPFGAGKG